MVSKLLSGYWQSHTPVDFPILGNGASRLLHGVSNGSQGGRGNVIKNPLVDKLTPGGPPVRTLGNDMREVCMCVCSG